MSDNEKLEKLKAALRKAGLDYVVTRKDETIAHLNIWIGED
jgi:hypothetical protein